jgi:hypothetical protein
MPIYERKKAAALAILLPLARTCRGNREGAIGRTQDKLLDQLTGANLPQACLSVGKNRQSPAPKT